MTRQRPFRTQTILTLLALALLTTGCSGLLVGTWKAESQPKDQPFYIKSATFKDDNTYTAIAKSGEDVRKLAGAYDFNGASLKLKTAGKPDRVYKAMYIMGGTLKLTSDDKEQTLKKQ